MFSFTAVLTGISPFLMHADDIEANDALIALRTAIKSTRDGAAVFKAGDDRFPASTWRSYLYHDGAHLAIPSENLLKSLATAGKMIPRGRASNFGKIVQTAMVPDSPHFAFAGPKGPIAIADIEKAVGKLSDITGFGEHLTAAKALGFRLWSKRAPIGQSKHVRVRPRFETWTLTAKLTVVTDDIDKEVLKRLFDLAGVYSGLGDWRPSSPRSPGPYGKFTALLTF